MKARAPTLKPPRRAPRRTPAQPRPAARRAPPARPQDTPLSLSARPAAHPRAGAGARGRGSPFEERLLSAPPACPLAVGAPRPSSVAEELVFRQDADRRALSVSLSAAFSFVELGPVLFRRVALVQRLVHRAEDAVAERADALLRLAARESHHLPGEDERFARRRSGCRPGRQGLVVVTCARRASIAGRASLRPFTTVRDGLADAMSRGQLLFGDLEDSVERPVPLGKDLRDVFPSPECRGRGGTWRAPASLLLHLPTSFAASLSPHSRTPPILGAQRVEVGGDRKGPIVRLLEDPVTEASMSHVAA